MPPDRRPADREISVDDFDEPRAGGTGRPEPGAPAPAPPGAGPVTRPRRPGPGADRAPELPRNVGSAGARLERSVRDWATGRSWWIRAPLLLWLGWILLRLWSDPAAPTIFRGIDLAIHEIGHILWSPLGEFMGFAGGTLTQLLAPLAAGAMLYRQRDWFGVSFAVAWLGINCFEIAVYAGDALARRLPLVSPTTAEPEHDWTFMLARLGLLPHTDTVASAWLWAGRLAMVAGIVFGAWVLRLMARERPER
jgi:hypothetical protein